MLAGPFTEDLTLNGTTGVNTAATNIRYIESLEVLTAGSGGVNAGVIQVWTGTGATGSIWASIVAGARAQLSAHHYVATGYRCYVQDTNFSSTAASANFPEFNIRYQMLNDANAAFRLLVSNLRVQGNTARSVQFSTPRSIEGPAWIVVYYNQVNSTSQTGYNNLGLYDMAV